MLDQQEAAELNGDIPQKHPGAPQSTKRKPDSEAPQTTTTQEHDSDSDATDDRFSKRRCLNTTATPNHINI